MIGQGCYHKDIDDEGICKACGVKAAVHLLESDAARNMRLTKLIEKWKRASGNRTDSECADELEAELPALESDASERINAAVESAIEAVSKSLSTRYNVDTGEPILPADYLDPIDAIRALIPADHAKAQREREARGGGGGN